MNNVVTDWLHKIAPKSGLTNIKPLTLTIESESFIGASYDVTLTYTAGMDIVSRGDKQVGEQYVVSRYYFLGKIPAVHKKQRQTCYTWNGKTLFMSSHYQGEEINEYHPLGKCFILGVWDEEALGKIDTHTKPYKRIEVDIK